MAKVPWTENDFRIAVTGYLEMHNKFKKGERFVKKQYYAEMNAQNKGISCNSFEFRMQNIAYVIRLLGEDHIPGLPPLSHVSQRQVNIIKRLIKEYRRELPAKKTPVLTAPPPKEKMIPRGKVTPKKNLNASGEGYERDQRVRDWVLTQANGICEYCEEPAPFFTAEGKPFLEGHHVVPLEQGGADTVQNMVALCPNCHREFHYGACIEENMKLISASIPRLKRGE